MAFIPVPRGVQAELRFTLDEQKIENTLWFDALSAPTSSQLAALGDALMTWWLTGLRTISAPELQIREVYVTDMTSATGGTSSTIPSSTPTGSSGTPPAPNQCALCVTFRTAARGRTARGRNYIAGLPQSQLVSNSWSSAMQLAVAAEYAELMTPANTAGLVWSVCSRYEANAPRAAGVLRPVTSVVIVDPIVDSQRRRTPGRGT